MRWATDAASTRLATPSLARMWDTWTLAVFSLMNRALAIWRFDAPLAIEAQHLPLP